MPSKAKPKAFKGFTDEERVAMKERVQELKAAARRGPRAEVQHEVRDVRLQRRGEPRRRRPVADRLRAEGVDRRRRGKDRRAREESGELRTDLATGPRPGRRRRPFGDHHPERYPTPTIRMARGRGNRRRSCFVRLVRFAVRDRRPRNIWPLGSSQESRMPYRWVRNPIYISALLVVLGQAWLLPSLPLLVYLA